jgi:integrase
MAFIYNRGSRDNPNWYGRYKDDASKWVTLKIPDEHYSKKLAQRWIDQQQEDVDAGRPDPRKALTCGELMAQWKATLTNRNAADDRKRLDLHVLPYFAAFKAREVDQDKILNWIDLQRATPKKRGKGNLSEATVRHHLDLLSRFFAWCIPRHLRTNPVRDIQHGKRPSKAERLRGDTPWLEDDKTVRELYRALPAPFGIMFYIGNRTGMRLGEICGLRLSSFDHVDQGVVVIRWTYDDGFLKEDKKREGKSKKAPVPTDLAELVKAQIVRRKAEGATGESLLFPNPRNKGKAFRRLALERAWNDACAAIGFQKEHPEDPKRMTATCTWYEGTRHSFCSRKLKETRGRALYEVAQAMGHRDTTMIAKHYARWIITEFSTEMMGGVGLEVDQGGEVLPFAAAR